LRKFISFQPNELGALREYLEEMALKGWRLSKINTFFYFDKIEPQALTYAVEPFTRLSLYDTIPTLEAQEVIDRWVASGWEYVCMGAGVNVFVTADGLAEPVARDKSERLEMVRQAVKPQYKGVWVSFFAQIVVVLSWSFLMISDPSISTDIVFISSVFVLFTVCYRFVSYIRFKRWCSRQKLRVESGQPAEYGNLKTIKRVSLVNMYATCIFIAVAAGLLVYSLFSGYYLFSLAVGFGLFVAALFSIVRYVAAEKKISRAKHQAVTFIFLILMLCLPVTVAVYLIDGGSTSYIDTLTREVYKMYTDSELFEGGEDVLPLWAEDFGLGETKGATRYKLIRSLFMDGEEYGVFLMKEFDPENPVANSVRYWIYSKGRPLFVMAHIKSDWQTDNLIPSDQPAWGAKKVYVCEKYSGFTTVVVYENCVFRFESEAERLSDESIAIIREKLKAY